MCYKFLLYFRILKLEKQCNRRCFEKIHMAEVRFKWQALVNTVFSLLFP